MICSRSHKESVTELWIEPGPLSYYGVYHFPCVDLNGLLLLKVTAALGTFVSAAVVIDQIFCFRTARSFLMSEACMLQTCDTTMIIQYFHCSYPWNGGDKNILKTWQTIHSNIFTFTCCSLCKKLPPWSNIQSQYLVLPSNPFSRSNYIVIPAANGLQRLLMLCFVLLI